MPGEFGNPTTPIIATHPSPRYYVPQISNREIHHLADITAQQSDILNLQYCVLFQHTPMQALTNCALRMKGRTNNFHIRKNVPH